MARVVLNINMEFDVDEERRKTMTRKAAVMTKHAWGESLAAIAKEYPPRKLTRNDILARALFEALYGSTDYPQDSDFWPEDCGWSCTIDGVCVLDHTLY